MSDEKEIAETPIEVKIINKETPISSPYDTIETQEYQDKLKIAEDEITEIETE